MIDAALRVLLSILAVVLFTVLRHWAGWSLWASAGAGFALIAAAYVCAFVVGMISESRNPTLPIDNWPHDAD